ncbi:hypothetical protein BU17DRAFT_89485 [Hysterangium stoloniferum]|nr:hypothetical protein BU17DRAFT_89485 [Hysterangium stoloniferum]
MSMLKSPPFSGSFSHAFMHQLAPFTRHKELVAIFISYLETPSDLLHLALTTKAICRIIIPWFLNFYHIRCHPLRTNVWRVIRAHPQLAARIKVLELVSETKTTKTRQPHVSSHHQRYLPPIIPAYLHTHLDSPDVSGTNWPEQTFEDAVLVLANTVKLMATLKRFCWGANLRVTNNMGPLFTNLVERCRFLEEFHLDFNQGDYLVSNGSQISPVSFNTITAPLINFQSLTNVSLIVENYDRESDQYGRFIQDCLLRCKGLTELLLDIYSDNEQIVLNCLDMLEEARWPLLRKLTVTSDAVLFNVEGDSPEDFLSGFLETHNALECLYIKQETVYPGFLKADTLPNLRSLELITEDKMSRKGGYLHNYVPCDIALHIQHIHCPISLQSLPLLRTMTSLRSVHSDTLEYRFFERFVEAVPRLERLCAPFWKWNTKRGKSASGKAGQKKTVASGVVDCLLKLTNLIQIQGCKNLLDYDAPEGREPLKSLMTHRTLTYLESNNGGWVKFVRDDSGAVIRCDEIRSYHAPKAKDWGDIFMGSIRDHNRF